MKLFGKSKIKQLSQKRRTYFSPIVLFALLLTQAHAQVLNWGANVDVELRRGQQDSRPNLNQTPSDKWTLFTPNIRLFLNTELDEKWWADVSLQADF